VASGERQEAKHGEVVLMGVGDVGPIHEPLERYSALAKDTLAAADLRFAQVERVYSTRGALQVHSGGGHSRLDPRFASVFGDCGFDVVSVASNHAMDWGEDALLDTVELFRERGMAVVGAGRNLREARRPAIVEKNGLRIAFLAYCSILQNGYAAARDKEGIAPLRAHTYYEPHDYQAGVPPKVVTVPYEDDLAGMLEDIAEARKHAHAVVLSLHWGIHFMPRLIADYQVTVANAAFRAGADLILGHHAHVPKAIEVYKGKAIFYSIGNFIVPSRPDRKSEGLDLYKVKADPEYPNYRYPVDARKTLIARCVVADRKIESVSYFPALINKQVQPEVLRQGDARFDEVVQYLDKVTREEGIEAARPTVEGDEVYVLRT